MRGSLHDDRATARLRKALRPRPSRQGPLPICKRVAALCQHSSATLAIAAIAAASIVIAVAPTAGTCHRSDPSFSAHLTAGQSHQATRAATATIITDAAPASSIDAGSPTTATPAAAATAIAATPTAA